MKVLKVAGYSVLAVAVLTACKSVSKIPVPAGENNVVNITAKKAELTDKEKKNWQHLDLATDTIPGMSVKKAYKFLENKKGVEVVVGIVDSGTDLKHEDLKDVAWVNKKEIPGNNIDDDKNGYVDDINGWNFLGTIYKENLEWERIVKNPSIADKETQKEVEEYHKKQVSEAKMKTKRYEVMLMGVKEAHSNISKHLGKEDYTKKEAEAIKTDDFELKNSVETAKQMYGFGLSSLKEAIEELSELVEKQQEILSGENFKKDYRSVLGDNPEDINDSPGYGDNNPQHSKKDEAHGTHVSGIVAASRNNGVGMDGVADNVKIMAVRSVPDGDEYDKDVALGIRYAVDNGAKIINTSFGKGFSPHKQWVYDAIKYAADKDVLIVNAAGNSSKDMDVEKTFPNDAPDLINEISDNFLTVGAITYNYNKNLLASFTNYGKRNVDVFAPGYKIYSTTPENEYKKFSGTSMASPSTAGVAALIRSYYPQLTASQVKRIIMNSGTKINMKVLKPGSKSELNPEGDLVPFTDLSASGRMVNAYNALRMADRMVNGK